MPDAAAAAATEDTDVRRASLQPGRWYAAALDTSPIPVSMALDTIEERLTSDLHVGSLRIYQTRADVPETVPAAVRDADGANVWVTGQYNGTGGEAPVPSQVLVIAEWTPPGAAPVDRGGDTPQKPAGGEIVVKKDDKKAEISTPVIVAVAVGATAVIGGGVALLMWLRRRAKKRKNARKKKRKK